MLLSQIFSNFALFYVNCQPIEILLTINHNHQALHFYIFPQLASRFLNPLNPFLATCPSKSTGDWE